jgi:hypothetical protein
MMQKGASPPLRAALRRQARRSLGGVVVTVELTLISVLAAVMLAPLVEAATPLIRELDFANWPYIAASLLLILWFWSEVIGHSITFISWPIDIGHYLFYIIGALVAAIQMHFLTSPGGWFALLAAEAVGAALIYRYDLRLMRAELQEATGAEASLLQAVVARQVISLRLAALSAVLALLAVTLLLLWPSFFQEQWGHVLLATGSTVWLLFLLVRAIRTLNTLRDLILARAAAELPSEEPFVDPSST